MNPTERRRSAHAPGDGGGALDRRSASTQGVGPSARVRSDGGRSTSAGEGRFRRVVEAVGASRRTFDPRRAGLETLRRRSEEEWPLGEQGDSTDGVDRMVGRDPRLAARGGLHARIRGGPRRIEDRESAPSVRPKPRFPGRAAARQPPALSTALAVVSGRILRTGGGRQRRNRSREPLRPPTNDGPDQGGQRHPGCQSSMPRLGKGQFQAVEVSQEIERARSRNIVDARSHHCQGGTGIGSNTLRRVIRRRAGTGARSG